mmetsp:Transcript_1288/g.4261  ORF Transcript_1288/g.4261 Transcript_1288/m.4261 type:complete len:379 (+) Transcript_1288:1319-2455(+)
MPPFFPQFIRSQEKVSPDSPCQSTQSTSMSKRVSHSSVTWARSPNSNPIRSKMVSRSWDSCPAARVTRCRLTHIPSSWLSAYTSGTLQCPFFSKNAASSTARRSQRSLLLGLHSISSGVRMNTAATPFFPSGTSHFSTRYLVTIFTFRVSLDCRRRSISGLPPGVIRHATAEFTRRSTSCSGTPISIKYAFSTVSADPPREDASSSLSSSPPLTRPRRSSRSSSRTAISPVFFRLALAAALTGRRSTVSCGIISSPQPYPRRVSLKISSVGTSSRCPGSSCFFAFEVCASKSSFTNVENDFLSLLGACPAGMPSSTTDSSMSLTFRGLPRRLGFSTGTSLVDSGSDAGTPTEEPSVSISISVSASSSFDTTCSSTLFG